MKQFKYYLTLLLTGVSFIAMSQEDDALLNIVKEELKREISEFSKATYPPYFIEYRIEDVQYANLSASFGSLIQSNVDRSKVLTTRVKIGSYEKDNTHSIRNQNSFIPGFSYGLTANLPIENEPLATKVAIWEATQSAYNSALTRYKRVKNAPTSTDDQEESKAFDFAKEQPTTFYEPELQNLESYFDRKLWEDQLRKYSALFASNSDILTGDVSLRFNIERQYLVSSEGTSVVQNMTSAYLSISSDIKADDGDIVPLHLSYFAFLPKDLPTGEVIESDIKAMIKKLEKLKSAPLAQPYTGPAILYSQTAGVFFHEIFGHRVEGHRLKSEFDGQTFKGKVNDPVLPKTLNVSFDPTLSEYNKKPLNGFYKYDDEGVKARRVNVVEKGILKTFLMSRTPLEKFPNSNGHGRASIGAEVVSRQSNLVVESSQTVTMDELRKMLIKECQKQGKQYGYFFKDVVGGFTITDRYNPNAFNIFPTEVYRIYVDGRPDELVRGVDLIGTPLAMFAEIKAAGNDPGIFTGFCGAESGSVPVSAISPSLFVRRIETQKKPKRHEESPLLARPTEN